MTDTTLSKLGGTCSILTGVTFVVVVVLVLLSPAEQQVVCPCSGQFLTSLADNSTLNIAGNALLTLSLLLTSAVVLAVYETVRTTHEGWARWSSALAIIGLEVNAIDALRHAVLDPAKATAYVQGDAAVKAGSTVPGALEGLDPQHWLRLGTLGLWILVVNLLALRAGVWPALLAYVGIGVALVVRLAVAGIVLQIPAAITLVAGLGAITLAPRWTSGWGCGSFAKPVEGAWVGELGHLGAGAPACSVPLPLRAVVKGVPVATCFAGQMIYSDNNAWPHDRKDN
jgi:hypothetical protein